MLSGSVSIALTRPTQVSSKGRKMLTVNKELRNILKNAAAQGWHFEARGSHIKGRHPNGQTTTISRTPSDGRAIKNIQRDLKIK